MENRKYPDCFEVAKYLPINPLNEHTSKNCWQQCHEDDEGERGKEALQEAYMGMHESAQLKAFANLEKKMRDL